MNEIFQKNREKIIRSGIRLAIFNSLFIFAKISGVTLLSSIFIAIILALLGTTIYVKVQSLMGKEGSTGFLQGGQLLGNEKLKRYYENLYVELNNGLQTLRKAALLTDPAFTGKIFAILFVCSNAAWHLGDFGFVWLAGNGYFTYPYVILFFGPQIRTQLKVVEDLIQSTLKKHKKD